MSLDLVLISARLVQKYLNMQWCKRFRNLLPQISAFLLLPVSWYLIALEGMFERVLPVI